MSSKFKFLSIVAVAMLATGLAVSTAFADVTGTFETHILMIPQTNATEIELIDFDIQNALNITAVISGLSTTFHSHFGIAGVEDAIVTATATLGALDVNAQIVFSRFAGVCALTGAPANPQNCLVIANNVVPINSTLLFVKKRVTTTLTLGGVTFTNLAIFEDVSYPETLSPVTHTTADQDFAFGDVLTLSGSTPSGVAITAQTGICAQRSPNVIKKHAFPFEVNPECRAEVKNLRKPDILFDFERLTISGVPVAPGITGSAEILCVTITKCGLTTNFVISGGPVPFTATLTFTDLLTFSFGGGSITLTSGAGTMVIRFSSTGVIDRITVTVNATLNPDTNPATLSILVRVTPGIGVVLAQVSLTIQRAGLAFNATAVFGPGVSPIQFSSLTFTLSVPGTLLGIDVTAQFLADVWPLVPGPQPGLAFADILLTIRF